MMDRIEVVVKACLYFYNNIYLYDADYNHRDLAHHQILSFHSPSPFYAHVVGSFLSSV